MAVLWSATAWWPSPVVTTGEKVRRLLERAAGFRFRGRWPPGRCRPLAASHRVTSAGRGGSTPCQKTWRCWLCWLSGGACALQCNCWSHTIEHQTSSGKRENNKPKPLRGAQLAPALRRALARASATRFAKIFAAFPVWQAASRDQAPEPRRSLCRPARRWPPRPCACPVRPSPR
jgi:hypothetical protein